MMQMLIENDVDENEELKHFSDMPNSFGIDEIYMYQNKRVGKAIKTIRPDLKKAGPQIFKKM